MELILFPGSFVTNRERFKTLHVVKMNRDVSC